MHELSICQALLDEVSRVARQHGAERVLSVTVRVGPLSGVDSGLLTRAFKVARQGTVASGARLCIDRAAVMLECRQCGRCTTGRTGRFRCGFCGARDVDVTAGEELVLQTLELETTEESHVQ
ncbi:MAG: hydrogenase maturation nickel metallochaperone HypA [Rhodospirillales bacterium]|nr:hydrogenase maturation nickel metallochaperone HypA [Rhodospirillales bacterium]